MGQEIIHLKDAAIRTFLKTAKRNRFAEVAFFKRTLNFAVQWGGMEPRDIADRLGLAASTVIQWKEGKGPVPGIFMRQAVCHEIVSVLTESVEKGLSVKEVLDNKNKFEYREGQ